MCNKKEKKMTNEYIVKVFSTEDASALDVLKQTTQNGGEDKNETGILSQK